jgi:hypothetical protein
MVNQPIEIEHYIEIPNERQKLYKKSLFIVLLSQIFGGAGLAAGITIGALLTKDMLGTESYEDYRQHYLPFINRSLEILYFI